MHHDGRSRKRPTPSRTRPHRHSRQRQWLCAGCGASHTQAACTRTPQHYYSQAQCQYLYHSHYHSCMPDAMRATDTRMSAMRFRGYACPVRCLDTRCGTTTLLVGSPPAHTKQYINCLATRLLPASRPLSCEYNQCCHCHPAPPDIISPTMVAPHATLLRRTPLYVLGSGCGLAEVLHGSITRKQV